MTFRSRKPKRSWFQRWRRRVLWLLLLLPFISALPVVILRIMNPPTSAFMIARQLEARAADDAGFRLDYRWKPLAEISPQLGLAVVASEDQKFPAHHGFDVEAIEDAIAAHREGGGLRGASTITQQVAKNLFLWSGRSFIRKGLEAWYTVLIELLWPKQRTLEIYLNIAEFGDGIYGAEAAAQRLFGKPAAQLTAADSALLAAVLPSPRRLLANRPGPYLSERQAWILRQMRQLGGPDYLREGDRR